MTLRDKRLTGRLISLMSGVVATAIEEIYGERPRMDVIPAPESERSGNA